MAPQSPSLPKGKVFLLLGCFAIDPLWRAPAVADTQAAALIQERGRPLQAGRMTGESRTALERAEGGDTPILTFTAGRGPVRLLLDTGAASALVSPGLVRRLGRVSRPLPTQAFSLAGGGADCGALTLSSTRLPELRLPSGARAAPLRLLGVEALVIPVAALPKGVDGVLGAPSLKQLPFVVDPVAGKVLVGRPAEQWRQAIGAPSEVVPLAWQRGVPLLQIRARSRSGARIQTVDALADTGAEGLFLTPSLAALLTPLGPAQSARLVGVCGEQAVLRQRLFGMGLGPQRPPDQSVEAIVTDGPVFSLLGVQAIVGQEWLRTRRQLWRLDASPPRLELW
ncbi:MAG: aspartyl protease family protein [Cyanobacteriota bacterium]